MCEGVRGESVETGAVQCSEDCGALSTAKQTSQARKIGHYVRTNNWYNWFAGWLSSAIMRVDSRTVEPLYCGHLEDLVKCPV